MGGSSGSAPGASPMISAPETMSGSGVSSSMASGGSIPDGSPVSAAAGCHRESGTASPIVPASGIASSCVPASGIESSCVPASVVLRAGVGHGTVLRAGVRRVLVRRHVVGRHDDSRVLVAEGLVEQGAGLAVPGLVGIGAGLMVAVAVARDREVGGVAAAPVPPEDAGHQEPQAGDPSEQHDPGDGVDDVAGRERPVVDAGPGVGPVRRQGQLGQAEQQHGRHRPADDYEDGERVPRGRGGQAPQRGSPSQGLAGGAAMLQGREASRQAGDRTTR